MALSQSVLDKLREAIEHLPDRIADAFTVARASRPPTAAGFRLPHPAGHVAGLLGGGFAAGHGVLRTIVGDLGRLHHGFRSVGEVLAGIGHMRSLVTGGGRRSFLQALGPRYAEVFGNVLRRVGVAAPTAAIVGTLLTRNSAKLIQATIHNALGHAGTILGNPGVQSALGPRAAAQVTAALGQFSSFFHSPTWKRALIANVGQGVTGGFASLRKLLFPGPMSAGMAATTAVAGVGATVAALVAAVKVAEGLAERQNTSNRRLAPFSGKIAFGQAQLAVGDVFRNLRMARDTEDTAFGLSRSVDRMRDSFVEWRSAGDNLFNTLGAAGAGFAGRMARSFDVIPRMMNAFSGRAGSEFAENLAAHATRVSPVGLVGLELQLRINMMNKMANFAIDQWNKLNPFGVKLPKMPDALGADDFKGTALAWDRFVGDARTMGPIRPAKPVNINRM